MKAWGLVTILLLAVATMIAVAGRVSAGAPLQVSEPEQATVGVFGTVSAIVTSTSTTGTIVLDGGEAVAIDSNTAFTVPDVETATIDDLNVGDRLAIVAIENGGLVALDVSVIPGEPETNTHILGVVTETGEGTVTLTDDQGNTSTIAVPEGTLVNLGDFLIIVAGQDGVSDTLEASEVADIDDVIERLTEDIEESVDESVELLKQLLETNGDQRLTALAEALARVPDQAQVALETALRAASSDLEEKYQAAGLQGPFVRVKGFVTAFNVVGGVGTTTVTTVNGDEVALSLVPATEIEDTIVVGDFVKAKYNLDLQAKSIEIDSDELTLKGTVATFTSSTLELADGTRLIIDEFTDIDGDLAVDIDVKVDAVPEDGSLTALEIKVEGGDRSDQREKENEEFKIEGTITNIATSTATSTAIVVDTLPVMVIPSTKVEGALAVGIRVKVEAIMEGGVAVALEVEAKDIEEEDEDDDRDSDIRLKGLITALSDTEIEIDGFGPILITSDTVIRGNPFVNAQVEVKAVVSADEFIATRINVEDELEIKGIVASFTSTMLVLADGTTLAIDADTRIIGALAVGAKVEIKADIQSDGKLLATRVKGEEKMEFEGTVAGFSSTTLTLIEGDITFVIDGETRLKGTLSEDAGVEVKAEVSAGGALVATRIKVEREEKHEKDEGEKAKFEGTVATFSSTSLVLVQGDRAFVITDDTAIKGTLSEGAGVKVEAIRSNGDLIATEIEVRDNDNEDNGERDGGDKSGKFEGTVATFNSTSLVLVPGDRAFVITDDTAIKGTLSEGAGVKVEAVRSNGDLVATKIEVRDNGNEDNDDDEGDGKEEGSDRDASNRKDEEDGKSESGGGNDDSSESDRGSGNGDKSDDQDQDDRSGGDGDEAGKEDKDDGKDDDEGKETTEETDNKDEDGSSDGNN